MACRPIRPTPGMAKTFSTTMDPPRRYPAMIPISVTTGMSAFFNMWRRTTKNSVNPLARATLTYSSRRTAKMDAEEQNEQRPHPERRQREAEQGESLHPGVGEAGGRRPRECAHGNSDEDGQDQAVDGQFQREG